MSVDIKNLENLAYYNAPMPKDLEFPEQVLFQSLRCLYKGFKNNHINEEVAKKDKNEIMRSYEHFKFLHDTFKQTADMRNKLSYHVLQINKNGCEMCKKAVAIFTNMER